mgnify:CR=1 FL=1
MEFLEWLDDKAMVIIAILIIAILLIVCVFTGTDFKEVKEPIGYIISGLLGIAVGRATTAAGTTSKPPDNASEP